MKNEELFLTYAFYTSKGRRLTIAGRVNDLKTGMEICVISCSPNEQFCKKKGRAKAKIVYAINEAVKKGIDVSGILEELKLPIHLEFYAPITFRADFIAWCEENFYKMKRLEIALPKAIYPKSIIIHEEEENVIASMDILIKDEFRKDQPKK